VKEQLSAFCAETVSISLIERDETQPRRDFDEEGIGELAHSIEETGLAEPLIVRTRDKKFQLVAGERRLRAVKKLGWDKVPAVITQCDDMTCRKIQMVENVVRKDLNFLELARGLQQMLDEGLKRDEVARAIGRDNGYVTWIVNILGCCEEVLFLVSRGQIGPWLAGHIAKLSRNGQHRVLRRLQSGKYDANEMVAFCDTVYAEENQVDMFPDVDLTSNNGVVKNFKTAFEKACEAVVALQVAEERTPGVVAKSLSINVVIARYQIKELKKSLNWLDKILRRKEAQDDNE